MKIEIRMDEKIDNIIIIIVKFFLVLCCNGNGNLFCFVFKILINVIIMCNNFMLFKFDRKYKLYEYVYVDICNYSRIYNNVFLL